MISTVAGVIVGVFLVMYTYNLFQRHVEDGNIWPAMVSLAAFSFSSAGLIVFVVPLIKTLWFL